MVHPVYLHAYFPINYVILSCHFGMGDKKENNNNECSKDDIFVWGENKANYINGVKNELGSKGTERGGGRRRRVEIV